MRPVQNRRREAGKLPQAKAQRLCFRLLPKEKGSLGAKKCCQLRSRAERKPCSFWTGLREYIRDFSNGKTKEENFSLREEIFAGIELIEEARRDLLSKVNYQYALKNLILKIGI